MIGENQTNDPQEPKIIEIDGGDAGAPMPPTEAETRAERLQRIKAAASKNKKRMLIVCAAVAVGIALLFCAVALIDRLSNRPPKIPEYDYHFYPTYQGDIMKYEQYLAHDRQIY